MDTLLGVKNLSVSFQTVLGEVKAVREISFEIKEGSVTAIVGESGCGKSVTAKSIMGLIKKPGKVSDDSKILFQGENIQNYSKKEWENYRGQKCSICFQDALTALNPTMAVGKQIMEKIRVHKKISKKEAWGEAVEMLAKVGIPNPEVRMRQYPHEFSGGMRQRVMIAIAMTLNPPLVIADEPTTALDVTVQADILDMMKQMQKEYNTSILLITHDLGIVANFATNIIVMYAGKIIETGSAEDIFYHPVHPYTRALLAAVPRLDCNDAKLTTIEGTPPNMIQLPSGCPFEERCACRKEICKEKFPEETEITQNHIVSCHLCRKGD